MTITEIISTDTTLTQTQTERIDAALDGLADILGELIGD